MTTKSEFCEGGTDVLYKAQRERERERCFFERSLFISELFSRLQHERTEIRNNSLLLYFIVLAK